MLQIYTKDNFKSAILSLFHIIITHGHSSDTLLNTALLGRKMLALAAAIYFVYGVWGSIVSIQPFVQWNTEQTIGYDSNCNYTVVEA